MKRLSKGSVCYAFSRKAEPALRVRPGEAFCLETEDAYGGSVSGPQDEVPRAVRPNPATGPVFVEGAERGEVLRVDVERIQVRDYAVMALPATRVHGIQPDGLHLPGHVRVALDPMIGLIGTAPRGAAAPTTAAGEHGGSLDCPQVRAGSSVFLPVGCGGALLAAGCVHAVMADGKVCGCGAEVAAEVTLRARPVRSPLPTPCVETPEELLFLSSAPTLDECQAMVVEKASRFLTDWLDMEEADARSLLGLAGHLGVCQAVNPQKTMRLALAKSVLTPLGLGDVPAFRRRG